jgi:hypothetical protein
VFLVSENQVRRTRAWVVGILGGMALFALALSAFFAPEAMAQGAPVRLLGFKPHICPGCPLCGMSRAFSCLTHAQFARAIDFNLGVLVAYPAAVALAVLGPLVWVRELWRRS